MLDTIEITPSNVQLLFGSESVPIKTNIIIKRRGGWISGKVIKSRVFYRLCRMLIKIDSTSQIFSYPTERFFLPYISAPRRAASAMVTVSVRPTTVCR